jgi:hypothetical protein
MFYFEALHDQLLKICFGLDCSLLVLDPGHLLILSFQYIRLSFNACVYYFPLVLRLFLQRFQLNVDL